MRTRWMPMLLLAVAAALSALSVSHDADAATDPAAALRERHAQIAPALSNNPFNRPLQLQSSEAGDQLQGSIDAVMNHPYAQAREHLQQPSEWCEILMLHLNTKHCVNTGNTLGVHIGRKHDQPLKEAYRVNFDLQPLADRNDYLDVRLTAGTGPFSTRDYRIQLQAIPIEGGSKTYLRLAYSYRYGMAAKMALQGYLATLGADKVGFTPDSKSKSGHIGGVRGAVERNTMRYYLAVDAYLESLAAPSAEQRTQRLERWFASTEQYARQLHEMDRGDYLAMKQNEFKRLPAANRTS